MISSASALATSARRAAGARQCAEAGQPGRDRDHVLAPGPHRVVERPRPGPVRCGPGWRGRRTTPARPRSARATQERGDLGRWSACQSDQPAAGPDRRQHVLDGGRAQHPHGAVVRLLDGLEQRVAGLLGEPVGVLDDQDLPPVAHRRQRRAADQVADLVDTDRELLGADDGDIGMAAGQRRCGRRGSSPGSRAPAPVLALERGGEGDRGVGAARARRPGEQPGVAHPVPGGGLLQRVDGGALADQRVPDGHRRLRLGLAEQRRDPLADRGGDVVDAGPCVEHQVVVGVGRGQVEEGLPHPPVELQRLPLDPVALAEPPQPVLRVEVEHHRQVRTQVAGRPARDVFDLGRVERVAAGALVGQRRVDVAVGDDDLAPLQRGQHHGLDVLGLVGGVEQGLGAVVELAGLGAEHDPAHLLADDRVARLEGEAGRRSSRPPAGRAAAATGSTCRSPRRPRSTRRRRCRCSGRARQTNSRVKPRRQARRPSRTARFDRGSRPGRRSGRRLRGVELAGCGVGLAERGRGL